MPKKFYRLWIESSFEIYAESEDEARAIAKKQISDSKDPFDFCELSDPKDDFWD